MAEHKACADLVAVTGNGISNASQHAGECVSPSSGVDDSGTESGEDFRLLSPEILAEVQSALIRLESALPGLDPTRREALVRLVTRLQSCLKLQPPPSQPPPPTHPNPTPLQPPVRRYANRRQKQQRHTVGVSKEELADARRWLLETGQQTTSASPLESVSIESQSSMNLNQQQKQKVATQVFRPVKFTPKPLKTDHEAPRQVTLAEPPPFDTSGNSEEDQVVLSAALTFPREVPKGDSGSSLLEYDPSLALFTPAQSVQIAVHKAAINKQISEEESKREHSKREESYDSDDGDISSAEEEQGLTSGQGLEDAISSAQRLLQIATDKKTVTPSRFHARYNKKQKMKRANTIDIPKPANYEMENSSDEFGSANEGSGERNLRYKGIIDKKLPPPVFQPKTQSDLKFLAFLQQANKNEVSGTYNPSARGGQPWTNRFVNIKTAFEAPAETKQAPQNKMSSPSVTQNWQNKATKADETPVLRQAVQNRTPQPLLSKQLPWNSKKEEEGVVIGSLTVKTSPGPVNKFSHAQKSAFKPIEKRPTGQPQKIMIEPNKPVILPETTLGKKVHQFVQKDSKNAIQQAVNGKVTTSVSGTVKQLATQKFSGENVPSKPVIKQYPVIQDKQFNAVKPPAFVEQVSKSTNVNVSVHPSQQFPTSIASAHKQFSKKPESDTPKVIKIPQKTHGKEYKDGSECSPPKQYINSPPLSRQYSDSLEYTTEQRVSNSVISGYQINHVEQNAVPIYSQETVHEQRSTYTQPRSNYSPNVHPLQSSPHSQLSPQQNNRQEKHYSSGLANISSSKVQTKTGQVSMPYSQRIKEEPTQHRFSEETLVPNPLVLGEVYKPVPPDYLPFQPPSVPRIYETSLIVPINEPSPVTTPGKPTTPSSSSSIYDNVPSSKPSDLSPTLKQYLNIPNEYGRGISPALSNPSKSPYFDESVDSSGAPSPAWNQEDMEDSEISVSEGMEMQTAVSKVMGQAQCQKAVTVNKRTQHRYEDDRADSESLLRTLLKSPNSPTNLSRKQSFENMATFTEPPQPSKSPSIDKSARNLLLPDVYSYPVMSKPPTASPQNERVENFQSKPVSSAASAFRPLVNNLSKPSTSDVHRLPPPVPSTPPYGNKQESDRLAAPSAKFSTPNSSSSSSRHYESEFSIKSHTSDSPCRSPSSSSPSFPNVLQKSESWHQLVKEQMAQGRHPPPKSPRLAKTKSSHSLAFPKQFEAHLPPEILADKQTKVNQYLKPSSKQTTVKTTKQTSKQKKTVAITLDDSLDNVDEAFESLFQEVAKRK